MYRKLCTHADLLAQQKAVFSIDLLEACRPLSHVNQDHIEDSKLRR